MRSFPRLPHGVRRTFRLLLPGRFRDDVDDELRFHLECTIDELVAGGLEPEVARREARRRFGDVDRFACECRELAGSREAAERRADVRDELVQDVRWALRQLRRQPAATLLVVLVLALGIGAATALFGVADAVVFRPLPFAEPERLVSIWETTPQGEPFSVSLPNLFDWRESTAFSALAGFEVRNASLELAAREGGGEPIRVSLAPVTADFFAVLGRAPALGGLPSAASYEPGGDPGYVVLSHELWQRELGGEPAIIGRTLLVDREPHVVTGVLPPGAELPESAELWRPLVESPRWERDDKDFAVVARLAAGVSVESATAELARVTEGLAARHPDANAGWGAEVVPLREALVGPDVDRALKVLLGAVGFLLLVACVNVSGLLVARGATRGREMAVRVSVGASRQRLVRQVLTESAVLGVLGGGLGVGLATLAMAVVRHFGPEDVPRLDRASIDARVLAFAVAVSLVASLLFGLLPALRSAGGRTAQDLHAGRGTSMETARLRRVLVVAQLALAVTLVVGGGLTARSYLELLRVELGFDESDVLAVRVDLPESEYPADRRRTAALEAERRLAALAGVTSVGASVGSPFAGFYTANAVATPGWQPDAAGAFPIAQWRAVTPGYFDALDLALLRGRTLTAADGPESDAVVVSRTLAELLWPDADAVGKELRFGGAEGSPRSVVGVVGDLRDTDLQEPPAPTVFLPYARIPWVHHTWLVETAPGGVGAGELARAVREELRSALPGVPVPVVRPLARDLAAARNTPRFEALLMLVFGVAAAALAGAGVYGLVAYSVACRRREIGVRLALGARPHGVVRRMVAEGAALVAVGLLLGCLGALALGRLLAAVLDAAPPLDAGTVALCVGLLAAVTLLATWIPARKAAAVDPIVALAAD